MYIINTDFERPDPSLVERANKTHVAITGREVGPRQVMDPAIKPLVNSWRLCGPALTVRLEYTNDRLMAEIAAKYARPGDVIVVDAGGRTDTGVWGAGMTRGAKIAGCAGVVIDGSCVNGELVMEHFGLPVFCRGLVAGVSSAERAGWLNVPAICGGVIVFPGDIILGDRDGAVVIPRDQADMVLRGAEEASARASSTRESQTPYYEYWDTEAKLRALPNVDWR